MTQIIYKEFLCRFFEARDPRAPRDRGRQRFLKAEKRFCELGIGSNIDLLNAYSSLGSNEKFVAIIVFGKQKYHRAIPLLFRELGSKSGLIGGIAAVTLGVLGGDRVFSRLLRHIDLCSANRVGMRAVSALCNIQHLSCEKSMLAIHKLIEILGDTYAHDNARAMAAEGLANMLQHTDRRTIIWRRAVDALLEALDDPSPDVRCCSAYAIGELHIRKALKQLRHIAKHDHEVCPGIGPISKEAANAILQIKDGKGVRNAL